MPVFAIDALPIGDYLVLTLLVAGFLIAGAARLMAYLVERDPPEPDTEREHYADDPDQS